VGQLLKTLWAFVELERSLRCDRNPPLDQLNPIHTLRPEVPFYSLSCLKNILYHIFLPPE